MATYRLSVSVAKRHEGRSATAMAAYRAGEKLDDRRTGESFDYTRRQGVLYSEMITPAGAPEWARDRAEFWNRNEEAEPRAKATIAREFQLSLPHELNQEDRRELASGFARYLAERYNVGVDLACHAPDKDADQRNYHAHLLVSMRPFDAAKEIGLGNKVRAFDPIACKRSGQENHTETWRTEWERRLNQALERAEVRTQDGAAVRVDHRSYERQGVETEPSIKEGPAATAKKRRGEETERAALNEAIKERNEAREAERQREAATLDRPELNRRLAEQTTAPLARQQLVSSLGIANDNNMDNKANDSNENDSNEQGSQKAMPIARRAEHLTTEGAQERFQPSEEDRQKYAAYYKPLPRETAEQARDRGDRAVERAKQREAREEQQRDWQPEKRHAGREWER